MRCSRALRLRSSCSAFLCSSILFCFSFSSSADDIDGLIFLVLEAMTILVFSMTPQSRPFSLAILKDGKNMIGEKLFVMSPLKNKVIPVEIVSSHYVDPKGERVRS